MSPTTEVGPAPEDVAQIVDDITGAFLAAPSVAVPVDAEHLGEVVATVELSGAFSGTVVCSASRAFAVLCATRMLDLDGDAVDDDAVADAIGEVVNMIGGSVKALLPEPSRLSLPVVSLGDTPPADRGAVTTSSVDLHCAGEALRVSVLAVG